MYDNVVVITVGLFFAIKSKLIIYLLYALTKKEGKNSHIIFYGYQGHYLYQNNKLKNRINLTSTKTIVNTRLFVTLVVHSYTISFYDTVLKSKASYKHTYPHTYC